MAKLLVYAKMCALVYKVPGIASPDSWGIAGERTTNSGFKGASFFSNDELVITFAGTELKRGEALADVTADVKLAMGMHTKQADDAVRFYDHMTAMHAGHYRPNVTVTGHSLGGALAQAVGYAREANFVTFNAPGMMQSILGTDFLRASLKGHKLRQAGAGNRGKNYRLPWDLVSLINTHYGSKPELVQGGDKHRGHGMDTFISCLESGGKQHERPFKY